MSESATKHSVAYRRLAYLCGAIGGAIAAWFARDDNEVSG